MLVGCCYQSQNNLFIFFKVESLFHATWYGFPFSKRIELGESKDAMSSGCNGVPSINTTFPICPKRFCLSYFYLNGRFPFVNTLIFYDTVPVCIVPSRCIVTLWIFLPYVPPPWYETFPPEHISIGEQVPWHRPHPSTCNFFPLDYPMLFYYYPVGTWGDR
jgi:hypothetical protein